MASILASLGGANVGNRERLPSAVAGAALVAYGLTRRSLPGVLMAIAGSEMVLRGATGRCPLYGALGINTAGKGASANAVVQHNQSIQVKTTITIDKPAEDLYSFWRNFQNLPQFMRHLESVEILDNNRSHWVAKGPAGRRVQWDAEIINEKTNELVAWKSLPGADVPNAGAVLFQRAPGGRGTIVTVELDYAPPAGPLGAMIAKMFGEEPGIQIDEDMRRFKHLMETGETVRSLTKPMGRKIGSRGGVAELNKDTVQEASEESFPASDAPAWT